jgi:regulatory protein YycH of two-component signal transduction system YycFG
MTYLFQPCTHIEAIIYVLLVFSAVVPWAIWMMARDTAERLRHTDELVRRIRILEANAWAKDHAAIERTLPWRKR